MRTGRPKKYVVTLGEAERLKLESIAGSRSMPHGLVRRAKMMLWSAEGLTDTVIAQRLRCKHHTVSHWRKRYVSGGVSALADMPKSGRPRTLHDQPVAN